MGHSRCRSSHPSRSQQKIHFLNVALQLQHPLSQHSPKVLQRRSLVSEWLQGHWWGPQNLGHYVHWTL